MGQNLPKYLYTPKSDSGTRENGPVEQIRSYYGNPNVYNVLQAT